MIHIGETLKVHGKDGQLRIRVSEAFEDEIDHVRAVFIDLDGSRVPFLVESIVYKNHVLLKLDEVDTPEIAEKLARKELFLDASEISDPSILEESPQAEDPLVGFKVYDQNQNYIGEISHFLRQEFQDLIEVKTEANSFMWPLHENLILSFDESQKKIQIKLFEGYND